MILLSEQVGLQNVYTPLPFGFHLTLIVFATIIFLLQFFRRKRICYLLAALAVDATIITHFAFENNTVITTLEIAEILLVLGCLADIIAAYLKRRKNTLEEKENESLLAKEQKEREQKEIISDKDVLDNAFDSELNDLDESK